MYTHGGVRTRTRSRAEGLKPSASLGSGVAGNGSEQRELLLVPWGPVPCSLAPQYPGTPMQPSGLPRSGGDRDGDGDRDRDGVRISLTRAQQHPGAMLKAVGTFPSPGSKPWSSRGTPGPFLDLPGCSPQHPGDAGASRRARSRAGGTEPDHGWVARPRATFPEPS